MTPEKLSASKHPVLHTIGPLFTADQLSGKAMPINAWPQPRCHSEEVRRGIPACQPSFDSRMADVGWIRAQAWSAWFIQIVYSHALNPKSKHHKAFTEASSGSCLEMFRKLDISFLFTTSARPSAGAIAVWQYGQSWMGHAGIVLQPSPDGKHFTCMEAHNITGAEDGFHLKIKNRKITTTHQPTGLNLMGFITITT